MSHVVYPLTITSRDPAHHWTATAATAHDLYQEVYRIAQDPVARDTGHTIVDALGRTVDRCYGRPVLAPEQTHPED